MLLLPLLLTGCKSSSVGSEQYPESIPDTENVDELSAPDSPFYRPLAAPVERQCFQVRWGDLDGDGRPELAAANFNQPNDIYALEDGQLVLRWQSAEADPTQGVAWGDFDGDGDLDLAVANMSGPNRVYENRKGSLELSWSEAAPTDSKDVEWGDIDGDGDLDLFFANVGPNRIYYNEAGTLTAGKEQEISDETDALALADYDGDGDLDLATANSGHEPERDRLLRGSKGLLQPHVEVGTAQRSSSVSWARFSRGGPLALAVAHPEAPDEVFWVFESGAVERFWGAEKLGHTREVRSVDFDGDGLEELLWAIEGRISLQAHRKDGFTELWAVQQERLTEGVDMADADGDGTLDLAVGNRNGDVDLSPGEAGGTPVLVYLQRRARR